MFVVGGWMPKNSWMLLILVFLKFEYLTVLLELNFKINILTCIYFVMKWINLMFMSQGTGSEVISCCHESLLE